MRLTRFDSIVKPGETIGSHDYQQKPGGKGKSASSGRLRDPTDGLTGPQEPTRRSR